MRLSRLTSGRTAVWFSRPPSVVTSLVVFMAPLGYCLVQSWLLAPVGAAAVLFGEAVLLPARRWRIVLDAATTLLTLFITGLVTVQPAGLPGRAPSATQVVLLVVAALLIVAIMGRSVHAPLIAENLVEAACAVGFALLVLMAVRTEEVVWAFLALIPAAIFYSETRVLRTRETATSTAERLLQLPYVMPQGHAEPADLAPFAEDLRKITRSGVLWLHTSLPAGEIWIKASAEGMTRYRQRPEQLTLFEQQAPHPHPCLVNKDVLPAGWRVGVHFPLEAPRDHVAGYLLMGWTRSTGLYLSFRVLSGVLDGAIRGAARALGAYWANAWAAHELEAERARLSAAIDHSDVATLVLGTSVVVWNSAMAALTNIPADEAIGRQTKDLFTLAYEDGRPIELAHGLTGTPRLTTRDGRLLWVEVSCSAASGPESGELLTAVFVDKSARRQLDHMRHLLLVSVHHELHGPLTTIRGHAQLLETAVTNQDDAESIGAILDSVEMMQHIIADLVFVIDGDPSAWPVAVEGDIEMSKLLRRTLQSVPSVAARTVISAPSQVVVRGDPVRLRQCLVLVLGNAEKYAPEGKITVEAREESGHGVLTICDEGPGIPAAELRSALMPYYRSAATQDLPGSGVGLHIANFLMTSMRGRIELGTAPSGGLKVELWLPLASTGHDQGDEPRTDSSE
ncbi:sensor histidine kinase [Spirillospora sp. NBC_01491]|nr:ATP-binding protein [Spirillospora sp. NBC_01491]